MASFNGFPTTYPQYYPPFQMAQPQQPQFSPNSPTNGMIWVQGEAGAKSYLIAPNNTLALWDSEAPTIYLKTSDASGMPSMKILDYTIRENSNLPHTAPLNDKAKEYATKDDLEALRGEILAKMDEVSGV